MSSSLNRSDEELYWDSAFAIARRLKALHPDVDLTTLTLNMIYNWAIALPEFRDDPQLATDELLQAILQEWLEETHPL
jgi:FeS assembly protein IscX